MRERFNHAFACMGTVVSIQTISASASSAHSEHRARAVGRAEQWFRDVEAACNRFDESSELRRLCNTTHERVPVSDVLYECVQFAAAVADATNGVFDPTVGRRMYDRGFRRDYRTGETISLPDSANSDASYRDIELHDGSRSITLHRSLQLDLGAVAKGLAIDLAAKELRELENFMINAGGDLYLGGTNDEGLPWNVGIKHPRKKDEFICTVRVSDAAVCTSGDYERVAPDGRAHILDASDDAAASSVVSVTVQAPSAMVADALSTAAFALGATRGLALLEQQELTGLLITPALELVKTRSFVVA